MIKLSAALFATLVLAAPARADEKKAVEERVKTTVDNVLAILQTKGLDKEARRKKVTDEVEPLLDLKLMAKLALGKDHWPKLDAKQRGEYTDLFVQQLKASYFEKIDLYTDEKVKFGRAEEAKGGKYTLKTHIITKDQPVEMVYKLYKDGAAWKVYDLEIEGVSIVKSYGSQYDEVLRDGTVADLLKKMREKGKEKDAKKPA